MNKQFEEIEYLGCRGILFSNSVYEAVVLPDRGANLIRLYHKKKKISILREPQNSRELSEKKYEFGVPVLFFPNRIADGRFIFHGRNYRFPINDEITNCHLHGFLHDKVWKLDETGVLANEGLLIKLSCTWGKEQELRVFPHSSTFTLTFILSEKCMRQIATIENRGDKTMPLGLGYHTSFSIPRAEEYKIILSLDKKWEMGERHFPRGNLIECCGDGEIELTKRSGRVFGHYTLRRKPFKGGFLYGAVIQNRAAGYQVFYTFEEPFRHMVVWNRTGEEDFICIEPQTCAVNAYNIDKPDSVTGRVSLAGGDSFQAETMMWLEDINNEDIQEGTI